MTTYYAITTNQEQGYPSKFQCSNCFDLAREYDSAREIERCESSSVGREADEIACSCDMCGAALASIDADITTTRLDIDALMSSAGQ